MIMYIKKSAKNSAIFNEKIDIRERCKGVHCVDLGESFPTHINIYTIIGNFSSFSHLI